MLTADSRTAQLEVLNDVARIATLDLELRPMLQRITDTLAEKLACPFVALTTIDRERGVFVCDALTTSVDTTVHVGYTRPLGSGVVGRVAETGEPVVVNDPSDFPNFVDTMAGARSEICVPVEHRGELVAVLNLESTERAAFHDRLPLMITVADQIAGAIASAQLYAELRQRAQLMQMMSEVSRTALDATALPDLLDRVVRYIAQRFPLELVTIATLNENREEFVETACAGDLTKAPTANRWSVTRGLTGRCLRSGDTQLVLDVSTDPEYFPINDRVTSELVVPIRSHDHILGVLNLESASPEVFNAATVFAFEAFADQIAGAIRIATMNARLEATTAQLEQKTQALERANEHLANAIETLHRISTQDGLTGVSNRRYFDEVLQLEWRRATRAGTPLSLILIDIDNFKLYNDATGHQNGDECLRRVAHTLRESVHRAADVVARYGGEEFAVLLPDTTLANAEQLAETLRARVEALDIAHPSSPCGRITISIGVSSAVPVKGAGITCESFVRTVDEALYEAKDAGKNRYCVKRV